MRHLQKLRAFARKSLTVFLRAIQIRSNGEPVTYRKFIWLWSLHFLKLARIRMEKRSLTEKCPACGHRAPHKIEWTAKLTFADNTRGAIVHTCAICGAEFGERPVIPSKFWLVARPSILEQEEERPPNHVNEMADRVLDVIQ